MTLEQFRNYVRSLLAEPMASYWTDEEIDTYVNIALINIQNELWTLLAQRYNATTTINILPEQDEYDVPADCLKILSITFPLSSFTAMDYIPHNLEGYYTNYSLYGWKFENNKIKIYPKPTKADTLRVKYLPKFTITTAPEEMLPLLAVEAIIQAKIKDENVPQYLLILRENFKRNLIVFLTQNQLQNSDIITE